MRLAIRNISVSVAFGVLAACTQPGDPGLRTEQQAAADPACPSGAACGPGTGPGRGVTPRPSVPAVPDSPIKVDCEPLPTQLERDTCTNGKLHTG
jgi:hypothetical protein